MSQFSTCAADTALSSSTYTHDFTTDGFDDDNWNITAGNVTTTSSGALFTIKESGDAPTIRSKWYIFFGRVSFIMRSSPGTGIVSSAILLSDDLDELDWEFLGGEADVAQTNYFGKGESSTTNREVDVAASGSQTTSHNYTIVWKKDSTEWLVDGVVLRTLTADDAVSGGNSYPQTPMDVRVGIWAGGDSSNAEGTIEWAGGDTDYSQGPFEMVLEKVEVVNDNPGSSYTYGDTSGDADSIDVGDEDATTSASSQSSSTKTSTASGSAAGSTETATATQSGMWWTTSAEALVSKSQSEGNQVSVQVTCFAIVLSTLLALL
ncbi:transglycosylase [Paraconiothyrium brasiliense]|uniref:chitinase n=1 Tax=Paraconiothyrium brasiliense TaxID=300254 RepID=A0ABR3RQZ2_9PLEO